jgi:hypothetical protein
MNNDDVSLPHTPHTRTSTSQLLVIPSRYISSTQPAAAVGGGHDGRAGVGQGAAEGDQAGGEWLYVQIGGWE